MYARVCGRARRRGCAVKTACFRSRAGGGLLLVRSRPEAGAGFYADDGARHHERPLKRRSPEDVRPVPIPPALVVILREHLAVFGTAPDGRLFFGVESGENVPASVYWRLWEQAREIGLSPEGARVARWHAGPTTCGTRPCRAAAAGVPPTEVAERAGNSVKVLLTVYAKCLAGQTDAYNERIGALLDS